MQTSTGNIDRSKPVLVTGGVGFIGTHLCRALVRDGLQVRVLDLKDPVDSVAGVEYIRGDCRKKEVLTPAVAGVSAVFHFAAITSVPVCQNQPHESYSHNFMATCEVLEAIRAQSQSAGAAIRMIFSGSSVVYGHLGQKGLSLKEDIALSWPLSFYGAQKLASEQAIRLYCQQFAIPAVVFRFFNVYGNGQDPKSPYSGVISIFREAVQAGSPLKLNGSGLQTRDFVAVEDVARAGVLALDLKDSQCTGEAINLGTSTSVTIRELAQLMKTIKKSSSELIDVPARVGDVVYSQADISRARLLLNWSAKIDLKNGLGQLLS